MNPLLDWGIPIITWLQGLGDWLVAPMKFFTSLGNEEFYLLITPTILWCFDAMLGIRLGLVLLTSATLNSILKVAFGLPRPFWVSDEVKALAKGTTFGLPSGHSQNALVVWGRLAASIRKRWVTFALSLVIFLISLSRIFLGVHFPSDVLAGWVLGGLLLAMFLGFERRVQQRLLPSSTGNQIVIVVIFSLFLLAVGIGISALTEGRTIPQSWIQMAEQNPELGPIDPHSLKDLTAMTGALLGLGAGAVLLVRWGQFDGRGPWGKRALRYLIGLIGVIAIYYGLKLILPDDGSYLAQSLRYLRYAAVGFWVSYLAPRLFAALQLA